VVADLDAAGIDRAIVGGVSMGGYIALAVLRSYPERLAGLVLADTRSGADDAAALERRRGAAERADRGDIAAGPDAIAPLIADTTAGAVREELARIAADVPPASVAWAQRAMAARPDSTDVLAAARVPLLIVVGERDAVTPPAAAQDMARVAQDVELVELPGVAHLTPAEDPPGFADALTGWLTRHF
jgi:pimeloyl-ACP methyl ester carboxylesterase